MTLRQKIERIKSHPEFDKIESELVKAKLALDYWLEKAQEIAEEEHLDVYLSMAGTLMFLSRDEA